MTDLPQPKEDIMIMHPKKRIEILVEAPAFERVAERLSAANTMGYSVLPVITGRGRGGTWSSDGQVADAGKMVAIICIVDEARLDEVVSSIFAVLSRQIGIVSVSDVADIRGERF